MASVLDYVPNQEAIGKSWICQPGTKWSEIEILSTQLPPERPQLTINKLVIGCTTIASDRRVALDQHVRGLNHVMVISPRCDRSYRGELISIGVNRRDEETGTWNVAWEQFFFEYPKKS